MRELRFAIRRLRRRPGRALATALALAIGIGATTAAFAAVDAGLLEPWEAMDLADAAELADVRAISDEVERSDVPSLTASTPPSTVPASTRRQLTVLFCDLVGSTAFQEGVDPEAARSAMAR